WHFWLATLGIFMYWLSMQWAGITQGLMWRAFNADGALAYPDFVETVTKLMPMYAIRAVGGVLYLAGVVIAGWNLYMTWRGRPPKYETIVHSAPSLRNAPSHPETVYRSSQPGVVGAVDQLTELSWHRRWERVPIKFTLWVILSVSIASIFSLVPMFVIQSNIPTISTVKPYTPLELYGRDIYLAEGCYNCHSQMIRPIWAETVRYSEYSKAGEFVYDHPFQWGSRRIGPDLARIGEKYSHDWHVKHFDNPRAIVTGSIMPAYPYLLEQEIDWGQVQRSVDAMALLGVPYTTTERMNAVSIAEDQAAQINQELIDQGGATDVGGTKVIALVAYLQRLGTDLFAEEEAETTEEAAETIEGEE
ncbi:MAG: cytochrome-c oxidase, cbb3-type subunit II, partial [Planctomycetota bacterium]